MYWSNGKTKPNSNDSNTQIHLKYLILKTHKTFSDIYCISNLKCAHRNKKYACRGQNKYLYTVYDTKDSHKLKYV